MPNTLTPYFTKRPVVRSLSTWRIHRGVMMASPTPEEARMDISLLRKYLKDNAITDGCYTTQLGQLLGNGEPLVADNICLSTSDASTRR